MQKKRAGGQKKPFTIEQVQLIRAALQAQRKTAQLALFEVGIASVLRASDLLALTVGDVRAADGTVLSSFNVKQQKTSATVRVTLSAAARAALRAHLPDLWAADSRLWSFGHCRYSLIVKEWAALAHVENVSDYSTHSIRKTYPAHIFKRTGNYEAARRILGHKNLSHTAAYLGFDEADAHALKQQHEM